jgi:hypothetical protein
VSAVVRVRACVERRDNVHYYEALPYLFLACFLQLGRCCFGFFAHAFSAAASFCALVGAFLTVVLGAVAGCGNAMFGIASSGETPGGMRSDGSPCVMKSAAVPVAWLCPLVMAMR